MFRITRNPPAEPSIDVRIEGRLTPEAIPDLRQLLASRRGLTLDLSGLSAVDGDCRALLVGLRQRGHRLVNPSPYIARLLEETHA